MLQKHVSAILCYLLCLLIRDTVSLDKHGGVPMGVVNSSCDDAVNHLEVDWDNSTGYEYTCTGEDPTIPLNKQQIPSADCTGFDNLPLPLHKCMKESIQYTEVPPVGGSHRPLWPRYGEYLFVPPQRWIHSLEHGAAVFLYHPCADQNEIENLKKIARSCLRRHIITPYRNLTIERPYAIITYGCKLLMAHVNQQAGEKFVQMTAMRAPEKHVYRDGQYSAGLKTPAAIVTDEQDSIVCPDFADADADTEETSVLNGLLTDVQDEY